MASFRYTIPNLTFCGGAIMSNTHILTAAHCLYKDENRFPIIRIYTGITNTHSISGPTFEIDHVVFYPEFTGVESLTEINNHDICVVWV
jgi:secreted trypsin-like serine protease